MACMEKNFLLKNTLAHKKKRLENSTSIKLRTFVHQKNTIKKVKMQTTM